mmetsp:Transcript_62889/g.184408  ORF Transcript_62889/g.184408 Transcript_62889/m.184408 type:complete len:125 (-) Transcript_62889:95-469(-)
MARFFAVTLMVLALPAAAINVASNSTTKFTVNDQVFVGGQKMFEGSSLDSALMCHSSDTSSFKVCGCHVKVIAHLLTECQTYKKYDTQIGTCDCSNSGCDQKDLSSGYSATFNWKASSFEVAAC